METWTNLNPQQQIKVLAVGGILLLLGAYFFAIRTTVGLYSEYQHNKRILEQAAHAPAQIRGYQERLAQMSGSVGQRTYNREQLFATVNTFCREEGLSLTNFKPEVRRNLQDYELITNPIEVTGDFKDMVRLAYLLEHETQTGHIASASYIRKKDVRTKKIRLHGTLYLQNVIPEDEK